MKDRIQLICGALDIMSKTLQILKKLTVNNEGTERPEDKESIHFYRMQLEDTINKVKDKLKGQFTNGLTQISAQPWRLELQVIFAQSLRKDILERIKANK